MAGGCLFLSLLAATLLAAEMHLSGRARPPLAESEAAVAAYQAASRGPAARLAPEALQKADVALRAALLDLSRQQARLLPWRDFRPVGQAFGGARELALQAHRLGQQRLDGVRAAAEEAVRASLSAEQHAAALLAATTVPREVRANLQRARLLVREAEALLGQGEVEAARERALLSRTELETALGPALQEAERFTSGEQIGTWQRWIEETRAWSRSTGRPAIVVLKEKNLLLLLSRGALLRTYSAEVGANALGVKRRQGDRATPEGRYRVVKRKDRGQSVYHRALLLDYPNAADRGRFAAAVRQGLIPRGSSIGGSIEIHGGGGRGRNWTDGCVALANDDMDDLFSRVGVGTPVTIVGGDGRDGAFSDLLARATNGREVVGP